MAKTRYYISNGMFGKTSRDDVADLLRRHTGYYYTLYKQEQKSPNLNINKMTAIIDEPIENAEVEGGCYDVNSIFKAYPIAIKSDLLADGSKDEAGRTLKQFEEAVYGKGPEEGMSPLVQTDAGLFPFGSTGMFTKNFFARRYYDYSFSLNLAINKKKLDDKKTNTISPTFMLGSNYNFYIEEYEQLTNEVGVEESSMPYMYNFIDEIHNGVGKDALSSLKQDKRFFWNDPKCHIFLGGSTSPVGPVMEPFPYNLFNSKESGYKFNFASSMKNTLSHMATLEKYLIQHKELSANKNDEDASLYSGQAEKTSKVPFKTYFKEWTMEYKNPSAPIPGLGVNPEIINTINVDSTLRVRELLRNKYRNIMVRQVDLLTYKKPQEMFPMNINFSLDKNIHTIPGDHTRVKKLLINHYLYEPLWMKLLDDTSIGATTQWANYGGTGDPAFLEADQQDINYYDPEYLYPLFLDSRDDFFEQRTGFERFTKEDSEDENESPSIVSEMPMKVRMLDFKEFVEEMKQMDSDFVFPLPPWTDFVKQARYAEIGAKSIHSAEVHDHWLKAITQTDNTNFAATPGKADAREMGGGVGQKTAQGEAGKKAGKTINAMEAGFGLGPEGGGVDGKLTLGQAADATPKRHAQKKQEEHGGMHGGKAAGGKAFHPDPTDDEKKDDAGNGKEGRTVYNQGNKRNNNDYKSPNAGNGTDTKLLGGNGVAQNPGGGQGIKAGFGNTNIPKAAMRDEEDKAMEEQALIPEAADYLSTEIYEFVKTKFFDYVSAGNPLSPKYQTYKEVLFWRVSKHEFDPATGSPDPNPIQNTYFPNVTESIEYADTQVKYDKQYHYVVHAIVFLIGKKYFYTNPQNAFVTPDGSAFSTTFDLIVEPDVVIADVPYVSLGTISAMSPPPSPPFVEFVPFKGVSDRVLISVKNSSVSSKRLPVPVEQEDHAYYKRLVATQNLSGEDEGKVFFKSDDPVKSYRVYRLKKKPSKISDFAHSYTEVVTDLENLSYNDTVEPNTKYYYMFRSQDIHGAVSNPSYIYEFELVTMVDGFQGAGPLATYPIIKAYSVEEFFKGKPLPKRKNFRRYIHIRPSQNQQKISNYAPDRSAKEKNYAPEFGVNVPKNKHVIGSKISHVSGSLGTRKIKIRLTSKSTGRKIDLNLNFNHVHVPYDDQNPKKNDMLVSEKKAKYTAGKNTTPHNYPFRAPDNREATKAPLRSPKTYPEGPQGQRPAVGRNEPPAAPGNRGGRGY
tara:strand:+ start:2062 stop:5769 length:3708 start_codon:yes stop_codon:yes gene_type:complete